MKKSMMIAVLMTIAIAANAVNHKDARMEARIATDRMARELRLTDRQWREVYDINLRYAANSAARDHAMHRVLSARQFETYLRDKRMHMAAPKPVAAPHHGKGARHNAHKTASWRKNTPAHRH